VKPAREHCSIGVDKEAVVLGEAQLRSRVEYVLETFHQPALVEDFIDGREFHVSIFGDGQMLMLPPAEMDFREFSDVRDRLCTFDSKNVPGSTHYKKIRMQLPAKLDPSERERLEKTASDAYRVLGCRDYARIDIRLRNGVFYVLDINPNADITCETSIVCAAEAAGFSYGSILSYLVNLAARRHPKFGMTPTEAKEGGIR
jgi:D-alanine-D-alanine ligase